LTDSTGHLIPTTLFSKREASQTNKVGKQHTI